MTTATRLGIALALALSSVSVGGACGHKDKGDTGKLVPGGAPDAGPTALATAPTCEEAVNHVIAVLSADPEMSKELSPEMRADIMKEGMEECQEKQWSPEMRTCYATLTDKVALKRCEDIDKGKEGTGSGHISKDQDEATSSIKKIYDGARSYYLEELNARGSTTPIAKQFPVGDTGDVPAVGSCCKSKDGMCAPDPMAWSTDLWSVLKFSMDDPHRYSYRYIGTATTFTARAEGDLDCDGNYSTFEMIGKVDPEGNVTGSGAGVFESQPLE